MRCVISLSLDTYTHARTHAYTHAHTHAHTHSPQAALVQSAINDSGTSIEALGKEYPEMCDCSLDILHVQSKYTQHTRNFPLVFLLTFQVTLQACFGCTGCGKKVNRTFLNIDNKVHFSDITFICFSSSFAHTHPTSKPLYVHNHSLPTFF